MAENDDIRVRIAPSPTGYLHLGTMRTALVNYVFAKKEGGKFIVRMEDTDTSRSLPIYEEDILAGLKMVGIDWDEGPDVGGDFAPYRQSERGEIYKEYIEKLVDNKQAYWCFCSKEDLDEERKAMLASGIFPKYSGKCRSLSEDEIKQNIKDGNNGIIRLAVPSGLNIEFSDIIRGKISTSSDTIDDFVIAKDLQSPLYNLAVVIDDYLMKISHVIRGEDHIPNTPRQILIQRAFGFEEIKYAHLPLVLAPDRSKMSKRKMETSFVEYLKEGYLPQALLNFLILLGWHPEDDKEIMDIDEIISKFSLRRVQKGGAIFNVEKLDWFNSQYIKNIPLNELFKKIKDFIPKEWLEDKEKLKRALAVERDRLVKLSDFKELAQFF
ncbi:MAG: glutamate--tRNA ligase [Candidatus Paceibacterota bacterium]